MKIGFCGTMSVGKSTLVHALKELPEFKDYFFATERSKYLRDLGIPLNTDSTLKGQTIFLAERCSELMRENVITDRTVIDVMAFAQCAKSINYTDKIVRPITRTRIRDNAVYYDAVALYSTKRNEFQQRIFKTIEDDFKKRGLVLEQLLIRNINLPTSVKTTIESKINAEQDAQKMQFVLQKEKQEAERKRVEAQGIADYQRIISTNLTDKQLQYEQIKAQKELAASPNTKIIFMGKNNGSVILSDK